MNDSPRNPTELLMLNPSTQTSIDIFSDGVIESVQRGEINPLTVLVQLRAMAKASERILNEIQPNLLKEAELYPEKEFDFMGNKISKAEHGTKYNYEVCKDPVYQQRLAIVEESTKQLKEREAFLKDVTSKFSLLDEGSGEVIEIHPPVKTSKSGLNVSIK